MGSKQRNAILKALKGTTSHPSADWIYEQVRHEIPNISLGTVYRNLRLLAKSGEIQQLDTVDSTSRFDGNTESHYHFRCEKCGRIFDLQEQGRIDRAIEERIASKTGFKVTRHRLEFLGLCRDCQQQA